MATLGILGSHLAGDFFLGVDILVSSMLVNFLMMAVSVLTLPRRNPSARRDRSPSCRTSRMRTMVAALGVIVLAGFLAVHTWKDLTGPAAALGTSDRRRVWAVVHGDRIARLLAARFAGFAVPASISRARFAAAPE